MANSLRDQLLKSGMASKKQAKAAAAETRAKAREKRKAIKSGEAVEEVTPEAVKAEQARKEQAVRDRELNRQREEARRQKNLGAQVRQIVEKEKVEKYGGDIAHRFTHGKQVKTLHVDKETHRLLGEGRLGVIYLDEKYWVVSETGAEKILDRLPESVLLLNDRSDEQLDKDDPYEEFPVPDDLMW